MNVDKMLQRIKDAKAAAKPAKKVNGRLISYDVEAEKEELGHIDKFLRLIANDKNVSISYKKTDTAYINMQTKEITLPTYILQDRDLYLLMGSHEVSHALHTPREFYESHNKVGAYPVLKGVKLDGVFYMCINIVEDIRIERLIRIKFPGFKTVYRRAYKKLMDNQPGFMIKDQNEWDSLQIHNKLNMYAKGGDVIPYVLTDDEMAIYKDISDTVTFNDVLIKSLVLYKLIKQNIKDAKKSDPIETDDTETDDTEGTSFDMDMDDDDSASSESDEDSDTDYDEEADSDSEAIDTDESDESDADTDDDTSINTDSDEDSDIDEDGEADGDVDSDKDSEDSEDTDGDENDSSEAADNTIDDDVLNDIADELNDINDEDPLDEDEVQNDIVDEMENAQREDMQEYSTRAREVIKADSYEGLRAIVKNPMLGMVTPV